MRQAFFTVALLATVACGSQPDIGMSISLPWRSPLTCGDKGQLATLRATVLIGGHADCTLDVAIDLRVSGSCEEIAGGTIRPLVLLYTLPDPASTDVEVALQYIIRSVDLSDSPEDAAVTFGSSNSLIIYRQSQLEQLPDSEADVTDPNDLDRASIWAKSSLSLRGLTLDQDGDGEPNIAEACSAQLF